MPGIPVSYDPASLGNLSNTLTPQGLQSLMEAAQKAQQDELARKTAEASAASQTAGQAYQTAAAAPPPQVDPLSQFVPTLLGHIASVIGQDKGYTQRAEAKVGDDRKALMDARLQNLAALRANSDRKASALEQAGHDEEAGKARMQTEKFDKLFLTLRDQEAHRNRLDEIKATGTEQRSLETLRGKNDLATSASKAAAEMAGGLADGDAEVMADAIHDRRADPNLGNRVTKESKAVRAALHRKYPDFNLATAVTDWNSKEKFNATENSQRFVANRASIMTVAEHIKDYEALTADMERVKKSSRFRAVNAPALWMAKNGMLGPDAAAAAAALYTNRGAVASELAVTLAGGYAPQKEQIHEAQKAVDLLWSKGQQAAATNTIKKLLLGRLRSAQRQVTYSAGRNNPYLQDVTSIDLFGESDSTSVAAPSSQEDPFKRRP